MFFFSSRRRHTRCLSDWSSDVCSSDLVKVEIKGQKVFVEGPKGKLDFELPRRTTVKVDGGNIIVARDGERSEERRVGKECRSRGSPDHEKKKEDDRRIARANSRAEPEY